MNPVTFERERMRIEKRGQQRGSNWAKRAMSHLLADAQAEVISHGKRLIGYRMASGQISCQKRRFKTEAIAIDTLRQIAFEGEPRKQPVRAYACYDCLGWHLTSKHK